MNPSHWSRLLNRWRYRNRGASRGKEEQAGERKTGPQRGGFQSLAPISWPLDRAIPPLLPALPESPPARVPLLPVLWTEYDIGDHSRVPWQKITDIDLD
jgi:hypothetical protein